MADNTPGPDEIPRPPVAPPIPENIVNLAIDFLKRTPIDGQEAYSWMAVHQSLVGIQQQWARYNVQTQGGQGNE